MTKVCFVFSVTKVCAVFSVTKVCSVFWVTKVCVLSDKNVCCAFQSKVDQSNQFLLAAVPLAVLDAIICWWISLTLFSLTGLALWSFLGTLTS